MNFKFKFIAFAILILVVSCAKNPFTGKSTMALVPNSQIFPSAFQQYNQFLSVVNDVTSGETTVALKDSKIVMAMLQDETTQQETLENIHAEKFQKLKKKTIWAIILALPVVVIGMFFMDIPFANEIM